MSKSISNSLLASEIESSQESSEEIKGNFGFGMDTAIFGRKQGGVLYKRSPDLAPAGDVRQEPDLQNWRRRRLRLLRDPRPH